MAKMRMIFPCVLAFFGSTLFLSGQQAPPAAETMAAETETAPVMIDDMLLFSVQGIKAFPAEERAMTIARRIRRPSINECRLSPRSGTHPLKHSVLPIPLRV